jgi:hypothetical protein
MGVVISLMLLSVVSVVSAAGTTLIAGKIYDATNPGHWVTVSGASVTATCDTHVSTPVTSRSDGSYDIQYSTADCGVGSSLSVYATGNGLAGTKTGTIFGIGDNWDLGVVNVPMVPEFGLIAGSLTIISALAIFFVVRKK